MLLVGLMMYGFMSFSAPRLVSPNHYYVQGVGYATIMDILQRRFDGGRSSSLFLEVRQAPGHLSSPWVRVPPAGFSRPAMFIGAALGDGLQQRADPPFPGPGPEDTGALSPIAGMAAMVGGNDRRGPHRDPL